VYFINGKKTPWIVRLKIGMQLVGIKVSGKQEVHVGSYTTKHEAARAYDAEVVKRGLTAVAPLNFPPPGRMTGNEGECVVCGVDDEADNVLCDGCDAVLHLGCISLKCVPKGEWFCRLCADADVEEPKAGHDARSAWRSNVRRFFATAAAVAVAAHAAATTAPAAAAAEQEEVEGEEGDDDSGVIFLDSDDDEELKEAEEAEEEEEEEEEEMEEAEAGPHTTH